MAGSCEGGNEPPCSLKANNFLIVVSAGIVASHNSVPQFELYKPENVTFNVMLLLPGIVLMLFWQNVYPMTMSKTSRTYTVNSLYPGYMRQNGMLGIFGGYVPCERGTCTSKEYCDQTRGSATGYCYSPQTASRGVCCSFQESCGQTTNDAVAFFRNPNYPQRNQEPVNCVFTMVPGRGVCGVRIDFIQAILATAMNNACPQDSVTILHYTPNSTGFNAPFCGLIDGMSTVVQVAESTKVQVVVTTQSPNALWNIRLAQINCSFVRPPAVEGCGIANVQYMQSTTPQPMFRQKLRRTSRGPLGASTARIVGGVESPYRYPWMVAILLDNILRCGGSLVTHQWVLTAGHCLAIPQAQNLPDISRLSVLLGAHNLRMPQPQDMQQVASQISNVVRHPQYFVASNDIGMLRLVQPVAYTISIRPICLPQNPGQTYAHATGVIAGWGLTGPNGTVQTSILMSASVTILDNAVCNQLWSAQNVRIDDSMMCTETGMQPGKAATCGGDSGGPLAVQEQNGFYSVVGITSFGAPPICGNPLLPDAWTRVTAYLGWIYLVLTEV
ncbi:hypothetical protein ANN_00064 [Periplaneta americana]|uniref:Uncharacterized protein n=1 Tax=Periplaneta americana TaxID=6978 RepID=A0ABQ8TPU1_PERAM|nr:hypothetical protein ANN_00064 [Periplaneta americana]